MKGGGTFISAALFAMIVMWFAIGGILYLLRNIPIGFLARPPGQEYDRSVEDQIEGQRRIARLWFTRSWLIPMALGIGAIVAILM